MVINTHALHSCSILQCITHFGSLMNNLWCKVPYKLLFALQNSIAISQVENWLHYIKKIPECNDKAKSHYMEAFDWCNGHVTCSLWNTPLWLVVDFIYLHADRTTLCALIEVSSQTSVQSTRDSFWSSESKALRTWLWWLFQRRE